MNSISRHVFRSSPFVWLAHFFTYQFNPNKSFTNILTSMASYRFVPQTRPNMEHGKELKRILEMMASSWLVCPNRIFLKTVVKP